MKHTIQTHAQWSAVNRPLLVKLGIKITELVLVSVAVGAAFAWYF